MPRRSAWKRDIVQVTKEALGGGMLAEAIITNDRRERVVALVVDMEFMPMLLAAPLMLATLEDILNAEDVPSCVRMAQRAINAATGNV